MHLLSHWEDDALLGSYRKLGHAIKHSLSSVQ